MNIALPRLKVVHACYKALTVPADPQNAQPFEGALAGLYFSEKEAFLNRLGTELQPVVGMRPSGELEVAVLLAQCAYPGFEPLVSPDEGQASGPIFLDESATYKLICLVAQQLETAARIRENDPDRFVERVAGYAGATHDQDFYDLVMDIVEMFETRLSVEVPKGLSQSQAVMV